MNGDRTPLSFVRISADGVITVVSTARKTVSQPNTLSLHEGFEVISKEEFEKELDIICKGAKH